MFSAGGWRTLYTLFQMVADGVIDEMRVVQPGWVIGKSFYARQQGIVPDKWRTPRDTNFFMLFQVGGVGFVLWLLCVVLWWRVCGCGGLCVLLCLGLLWCCVSEPAVQVGVVVLDPC